MFLPYADDNPHTIKPVVNYTLIALNVAVFVWQLSLGDKNGEAAVYAFGMIPARLFGTMITSPELDGVPAWMTLFTSMFMHGGLMHIAGNMLYLWIFGDNIEASLGRVRYVAFYLLTSVAAALSQAFMAPGSHVPMIGASGAISGVLGAYLVLHPRANVRVFVWLIIYFARWNIPAFVVLGIWFATQLLSSASTPAGEAGVAFAAHIGGFVVGAATVFLFKKRSVHAFETARSQPFALETRPIRIRRGGSVPDSGLTRRRGPWD